MQSGNAQTFRVVAGPNTTGRLRNGDTDGRYWVQGRIWRLNEWRGPFTLPADADLAARRLLNEFNNLGGNADGLSWVQWGKRYYKQNNGGGNGGKWIMQVEAGYTAVENLPSDDEAPPFAPDIAAPL